MAEAWTFATSARSALGSGGFSSVRKSKRGAVGVRQRACAASRGSDRETEYQINFNPPPRESARRIGTSPVPVATAGLGARSARPAPAAHRSRSTASPQRPHSSPRAAACSPAAPSHSTPVPPPRRRALPRISDLRRRLGQSSERWCVVKLSRDLRRRYDTGIAREGRGLHARRHEWPISV
jgi:hypothetical protein